MNFVYTVVAACLMGSGVASAAINLVSSEKNSGWYVGYRNTQVFVRVCKAGKEVSATCDTEFSEALIEGEAVLAALPFETGEYSKSDVGLQRVEEAMARIKKIIDAPDSHTSEEVVEAKRRLAVLETVKANIKKAQAVDSLVMESALHPFEDFQPTHQALKTAIRKVMFKVNLKSCKVECKYSGRTFGDPFRGTPGQTFYFSRSIPFSVSGWELDVEGIRSQPDLLLQRGKAFCDPTGILYTFLGASTAVCE